MTPTIENAIEIIRQFSLTEQAKVRDRINQKNQKHSPDEDRKKI